MSRFFIEDNFNAFAVKKALLEDRKTIADRKLVVEKMRDLHEYGLKKFMKDRGLSSHWREKTNLTNVIWPFKQANGGSVTYLRIGYGKNKQQIDEMSKYLRLYSFSDKGYLKDDMAFHYITQLQVALNENSWKVGLYLGKHGWFEQNNLVKKLSQKDNKDKFLKLISQVINNGYRLYLYTESCDFEYSDSKSFVNDIIKYNGQGISYSIHIFNLRDKDDEMNTNENILNFIKNEFDKLLDLYEFIAWSEINKYINI